MYIRIHIYEKNAPPINVTVTKMNRSGRTDSNSSLDVCAAAMRLNEAASAAFGAFNLLWVLLF
jgi:hypothetical protein